jgi:hypothetical protein
VALYKILKQVHTLHSVDDWVERPASNGSVGALAVVAAIAGGDVSASPATGEQDSATTWRFLLI